MRVTVVLEIDMDELESAGTDEVGGEISDIIEYNTGFQVEQVTVGEDEEV